MENLQRAIEGFYAGHVLTPSPEIGAAGELLARWARLYDPSVPGNQALHIRSVKPEPRA